MYCHWKWRSFIIRNKYLKFFVYIKLIFFSFLLSEINLDLIFPNEFNEIILDFEPLGVSSYILDIYYPNQFSDYNQYAFNIDGLMGRPIYQTIFKKNYFNINEEGLFTQIVYRQKKSDLFFDTNLTFKSDLNNKTDFIFKAESKSLSNNINQNYLFYFKQKRENSILNIGYMYHIEDNQIEDNQLPDGEFYSNLNQEIESFNLGVNYYYSLDKINFKLFSSIELSNNIRSLQNDISYDKLTKWNKLLFDYKLNDRLTFNFNLYEKIFDLEDRQLPDVLQTTTNNNNIIKSKLNYLLNKNFNISFGVEMLNDKEYPTLSLNYINSSNIKKNEDSSWIQYNLSFILDNKIANHILPTEDFSDITFFNFENKRFEISIENTIIKNKLTLGKIKSTDFFYNYLLLNGDFFLKRINFSYSYYHYDTPITYINKYLKTSFVYSPIINSSRYRPFLKVSSNFIVVNSDNYDINIENINLFQSNDHDNSIITSNELNFSTIELGVIFDSFKISFIRKNPFDSEVIITEDKIKYIKYDFIDIVWYFKD